MRKFAYKAFTGLALASSVLLSQGVQAADITRDININFDLTSGSTGFADGFTNAETGKTFLDRFSFNVAVGSFFDAALTSIATFDKKDLDITAFNLYSGSSLLATGVKGSDGKLDLWTVENATIGTGAYTLAVEGKVLGATGGSFGGNLNVSPVPEPSTWGMMLGGLAALGFIGRRRKSAASAV